MKINLKQLSENELAEYMKRLGQKPYRTKQLIEWIYRKLALSFDEMTDFPKDLREELDRLAYLSKLNIKLIQDSKDGTQKFLFELEDGESIESVLIPNTKGTATFTLCISSQAGCAVGCQFCMTGKLGLKRNLKAHEIVDQVMAVKRHIESKATDAVPSITNIVFMGMGEPLNNLSEVSSALLTLTDLMGFSRRRITVSTAGIIPGIQKLAGIKPVVNLAISLNATTDEIRSRIMPINKKYPLKELIKACRDFQLPPNRSITFEYVLLDGINDSADDAKRLIKLLKGIRAKVNLIPYNPNCDAHKMKSPVEDRVLEFQAILRKSGVTAFIRKSMGADIAAACGQLKASYQARTQAVE